MLYYTRSALYASFLYFGRHGMTEAQAVRFGLLSNGGDGGAASGGGE